jgi:hypothetical protein
MNRRRRRCLVFSIYGHIPKLDAGGFESPLPLHVFIYLQGFQACKKPTFRGNGAKASSELVDSLILERLTGSEPRWPSYIKDAGLSLLPKPDTRGWDEYELGGSSSNGTIARDGDLLLDTQAVLVGPGMDSNHELYRFLKFRMLLILQSRRSRRNPQKQGHGTKSSSLPNRLLRDIHQSPP